MDLESEMKIKKKKKDLLTSWLLGVMLKEVLIFVIRMEIVA